MFKRDVAILLLSCFALFLSVNQEGAFSFRKAWYHVLNEDQRVGLVDAADELPPPVVADLNGDGHYEVLVATHDYKLQVVRPAAHAGVGEGFAAAEVVAEVSLLGAKVTVGHDRWPVAVAAGYLDPEAREKVRPPRKQVVVVVTRGWRALAFDHNLALLWDVALDDTLPPRVSVAEVALHVSPHRVREGDRGLVVVGGALRRGDLAAAEAGAGGGSRLEGVLEDELLWEVDEAGHARSAGGDAKLSDVSAGGASDARRRFAYHALEGGSGAARWTRAASPFRALHELHSAAEAMHSQHEFKLAEEPKGNGTGGPGNYSALTCREFRESVLHSLPHRWTRPGDAALEAAVFVKQREGGGQQKRHLAKHAAAAKDGGGRAAVSAHARARRDAASAGSRLSWAHVFGAGHAARSGAAGARAAQAGMAARHAAWAHNLTANALAVHREDGLEVLQLYTGVTLCQLHLPPHALHADINGDGVIEHIQVTAGGGGAAPSLHAAGSGGHAALGRCMALVTAGIPPRDQLWAAGVCDEHRAGSVWAAMEGDGAREEDGGVQVLPPVMLPVPRADGTYSHLRGQGGMLVFANDRGWLFAHKSDGSILWEVHVPVHWRSRHLGDAVPSLQAMALRRHAVPTAVLAAGAEMSVLVSEHGNVLATLNHPAPPAAPLLVADFNGDGLNDVVLVTAQGVFGYAQVAHPGGLQMSALLLTLMAGMGVVWWANQYDGGDRKQRKLRSTEYAD